MSLVGHLSPKMSPAIKPYIPILYLLLRDKETIYIKY